MPTGATMGASATAARPSPSTRTSARAAIAAQTVGRQCLCNSLVANIGLGQRRHDGYDEAPLLTAGDDAAELGRLLGGGRDSLHGSGRDRPGPRRGADRRGTRSHGTLRCVRRTTVPATESEDTRSMVEALQQARQAFSLARLGRRGPRVSRRRRTLDALAPEDLEATRRRALVDRRSRGCGRGARAGSRRLPARQPIPAEAAATALTPGEPGLPTWSAVGVPGLGRTRGRQPARRPARVCGARTAAVHARPGGVLPRP
jgi:hypothetical protein